MLMRVLMVLQDTFPLTFSATSSYRALFCQRPELFCDLGHHDRGTASRRLFARALNDLVRVNHHLDNAHDDRRTGALYDQKSRDQ